MDKINLKELKETDTWRLYEKGRNFMRMKNIFAETDKNYRFYNGNQWEGAKIEGIEQAQFNFIETIVDHKVSTINANLWGINYSSENFESKDFRKTAEKTCDLLNKKASKVWEKDDMDNKVREISTDSAVNDEGVIYVDYDEEKQNPRNEVLSKNDIQYGNENDDDIQSQPYIIIKKRLPIIEVENMAKELGVSQEKLELVTVGDNDTFEEAGDDAKYEKDDMCTLVTKMWKENGTVHFTKSVRYTEIKKDVDTGLHLYPVSHFCWKKKKGYSRGEGEVRYLIPNQIELNKTLARSLLSVKQNAYPQKIVNLDKVQNPGAVTQVGGVIKTKNSAMVEDVNKIFGYVQPAKMSSDVQELINNLINITRELKNASDVATGGADPEKASGKAILAIQNASKQPMNKQLSGLKSCIEDLARIWLDMWVVYTPNGITLEDTETDAKTGEEYTQLVEVPSSVMQELQGTVKVDITPKSAFDRYAQELSMENLLKAGYFSAQMIPQLKLYLKALPDDSTMPKQRLLDIVEQQEEEQKKIMLIQQQAQMLQQRANQFLNSDVNTQAQQIMQASAQGQEENEEVAI